MLALLAAHSPMEHVGDEPGKITFFTDIIEGGWYLPLLEIPITEHYTFVMTKFMLIELIAAGLIVAIFLPLARRAAAGDVPRGPWWNAFEALLTFIRDEVAKPCLSTAEDHHHESLQGEFSEHSEPHKGHHHESPKDEMAEVDLYVPFLWTLFLFILFCNLLGMIPFAGSPTASIWVTGALALISFFMLHGAAIAKMGFVNYFKALWPTMEIPFVMAIFIKPMILLIEIFGTFIKSGVLAVRLFANLFAGHLVLAYILSFIVVANSVQLGYAGWAGVTAASILGTVALSLLELFVAFLQAYIFVFLTALFMGMQMHPSH